MAQPAQTPATHSEVGQDAGGHAAFPPFDSSTFPSQLLWLAISFGALYYVMAKKALPAIGATIQQRKTRIAKDIDDATAMQQKADAAAAAHHKALADGARPGAQRSPRRRATSSSPRPTPSASAVEEETRREIRRRPSGRSPRPAPQAMANVGAIAREATGAIVERLIGRPAKPGAIAAAVALQ